MGQDTRQFFSQQDMKKMSFHKINERDAEKIRYKLGEQKKAGNLIGAYKNAVDFKLKKSLNF